MTAQGFKLILVDSDPKVTDLASKYEGAASFVFDFQQNSHWAEYKTLCEKIAELGDVSILVNAVEKYDSTSSIVDAEDSELIQLLNVNLMPMVFMNRFLGPVLKQRA